MDAATGGVLTTAYILNVTATHPTGLIGHAVILGNGCSNCIVDGLHVSQCYDYALVIKQHTGTEVKNCVLVSGIGAALYTKAAISANCHNNNLTGANGYAFQLLYDPVGGNKCQNVQLQNNQLSASGTGALLNWGTDAQDDNGGGVCDYNFYHDGGSGHFGNVRGSRGITSLAGLQAAWAGYTNPTNDSHSQVN
jgi:hypothetical protein